MIHTREEWQSRREAEQLAFKERYDAHMKSERWKRIRERALRHANYRCAVCHSIDRLEVHHASYRHLEHEPLADLIVLCHDCHKLFTEHRRMIIQ